MTPFERSPEGCPRRRQRHAHWLALTCALGLALAACVGPVGTVRVDPKVVQADLGRSAITTGEPSWPTRNVLFERGLFDAFDKQPAAALAELHRAMVAAQGEPDLLFALAELSYLHGRAAAKRDYTLAAAVYTYAFLFPEGEGSAPGRFDPRLRIAADLYNWALAASFASKDGMEVVPQSGTFALPFGQLAVASDPAALRAAGLEVAGTAGGGEAPAAGKGVRGINLKLMKVGGLAPGQHADMLIARADGDGSAQVAAQVIQPGQRLVQQDLAGRFGVAQSVVRESLLELQFCGLVEAVAGGYRIHEAARTLVRTAFEQLGASRVFATCDVANHASARVLEKAGLRCEATLEHHMFAKGIWWTSFLYSITLERWAPDPV